MNGGSVLSRLYFCGTDDIPGRPNRYSFSSLAPHNITVSGTDSRITGASLNPQAGGDVLNVSSGGKLMENYTRWRRQQFGVGQFWRSACWGISLQGTNSSCFSPMLGQLSSALPQQAIMDCLPLKETGHRYWSAMGRPSLSPYGVFVIGRSNTVDIVGPYTQVVLTNTHFIGTNSPAQDSQRRKRNFCWRWSARRRSFVLRRFLQCVFLGARNYCPGGATFGYL